MAKTLSGSYGGTPDLPQKVNVYSDKSTSLVNDTGSNNLKDLSGVASTIVPGKEKEAEALANKYGFTLGSAVTTSDNTRSEDNKLGNNIKKGKTPTVPGSSDGSMSDVSSSPYLKTIDDYIKKLNERLSSTVDNLNSSYEATKKATETKQAGETGSTQAGILRMGGYLGESGSGTGVMLTLAGKHRDELTNLQAQRDKAILDAQNAYEDKNFEAAKTYYQASKDLEQTMYNRQQDFFNNTMKATEFANSLRKPIDSLAETAIANGASGEIVQKIQNAETLADAVNAAGDFALSSTGIVGEYYAYKRDAVANGLTPVDFNTYQNMDANRKAKIAAAGAGGLGGDTEITPVDGATGITQAAGLSLPVFNYLTQGTPSMSRMSAEQRNQIMADANAWLNKNGIDISTFQSQYKAYNDVLQKNIMRANQTQIMAGEVSGSADALIEAIDAMDWNKVGNIKATNLLKLFTGEQVNDPTTMKYATQLKMMGNDLAGYFAASRGAASPELQDQRDAADVLSKGLSAGSVSAFKDSVNSNEEKVSAVVDKAVENTRKQVWGLFGVGDKYKSKGMSLSTADVLKEKDKAAKTSVDSFIIKNPTTADIISNLYTVPNTSDQDVWEYIQSHYSNLLK